MRSWLVAHLRQDAERAFLYAQRHARRLGAIAVVCTIIAIPIEQWALQPSFDATWIRVLCAGSCLPLVFLERPVLAPYAPALFWFSSTVLLMFMFPLLMLMNAATASSALPFSWGWLAMYFVALFLYILLMNSALLATIGWLAGGLLAYGCVFLLPTPDWMLVNEMAIYPLGIYATAIVIGSIANRNVEMIQQQKAAAAQAIGENIAHELRTPLSGIGVRLSGAQRVLPELVSGYERAAIAGLISSPLTAARLSGLRDVVDDVVAEIGYTNTVLNMLLMNTIERPNELAHSERFSVRSLIDEVRTRYPFHNSQESALVTFTVIDDFEIQAPRQLMVHAVFNLLKNALYFVQSSGQGVITVTARAAESGHAGHELIITDTGPGIDPAVRRRIFDRFYTTSPQGQGSGIGLHFCQQVIQACGGSIQCESQLGLYTTFRLTFPNPERAHQIAHTEPYQAPEPL